mmetsp:Transcript_19298/g.48225  ORF Transcript_19298/g.48225 Transcript_19298/m.48225 type:complete len:98 (-) Transcript_19298:449-742(-)
MAKRHTPTDNSSNTDITWDGSPLHRYAWYEAIEGMLAITDPSFRTLWEQGYVPTTRPPYPGRASDKPALRCHRARRKSWPLAKQQKKESTSADSFSS